MVITFGSLAVYFFRTDVVKGWAILAAAILVDLIIYLSIGRVTACYACRAEYRGCQLDPAHGGFDLATSEKY